MVSEWIFILGHKKHGILQWFPVGAFIGFRMDFYFGFRMDFYVGFRMDFFVGFRMGFYLGFRMDCCLWLPNGFVVLVSEWTFFLVSE